MLGRMLFVIDPQAPVPLFEQLAGQIRAGIVKGDLAPGERLPPARELAADLDVNQHTVLRVYQVLRLEGLLDVRQGRGAFVAASAGDFGRLRQALDAVRREAESLGLPLSTAASLLTQE